VGTLRLFAKSSLFAYKALFHWLEPSAYVTQKLGFPLLQLSFFALVGAFGGAQPLAFYLVGNAILVGYQAMFSIATSVADERWQGTLLYLVGSPANRVVLFFGRGSVHVLDGMIDVVLAFAYAALLFGLDLSRADLLGVALAVIVAAIGASALGLFLGAAAYLVLDASFLANATMFGLLLVTGANVPLAELPEWAQALGLLIPLTRTVEAARLYVAGAELASGLSLLTGDLVIAAGWALAGYALFGWVEAQARRRGTLEAV
jgi:ABC-2 type transport system permease protein